MSVESKIESPNYTQIPNVVFNHWMCVLSHVAFKVLMCVLWKTFSGNKTSEPISKNQLVKLTGLSKNSIQSGMEDLEKFGLLLTIQHYCDRYGSQPNSYSICLEELENV